MTEQTIPAYYYYIDPSINYPIQQPNPLDDLISVYHLSDISRQVARTNIDGSKAIKLRKSYKNQISDLSGKFSVIPTRENGKGGELAPIMFNTNADMMNQVHRPTDMTDDKDWRQMLINRDSKLFESSAGIDWDLCSNVLSQFERSYPSEFQNPSAGFQLEDLAFDLDGTGKSGGSLGGSKKRKNKSNGSSMATPNSDVSYDDSKRRRLE